MGGWLNRGRPPCLYAFGSLRYVSRAATVRLVDESVCPNTDARGSTTAQALSPAITGGLGHGFEPCCDAALISRGRVLLDDAPFCGAVYQRESGRERGLGGARVLLFNQTADRSDLVAQPGFAKTIDFGLPPGLAHPFYGRKSVCHALAGFLTGAFIIA